MELKFTGTVELIEPKQYSGGNKDYPRQPIKVQGIGQYHKNWGMFMIHGENIDKYPVKEGDVVDVYYRMNCARYADSGKLHGSNNVYRIDIVEEHFDPTEHF